MVGFDFRAVSTLLMLRLGLRPETFATADHMLEAP